MTLKIFLLAIATLLAVTWAEGEFDVLEHEEGCVEYKKKVTSFPNSIRNNIPMHNSKMVIGSVENIYRTSFIWCDLEIPDDVEGLRKWTHYGVDSKLHQWWVKKGCSGTFRVVECKPEVLAANHGKVPTFSKSVSTTTAQPNIDQSTREPVRFTNPHFDLSSMIADWMNIYGNLF